MEHTKPFITRKQYDAFITACSTAIVLCRSKIEALKEKGHNSAMYEKWLEEALAANEIAIQLGASSHVFSQEEAA